MKLYITIQRSEPDYLGPFDDDIDAQASCDLHNDLLIEQVEAFFPEENNVDIKLDSITSASCVGYGWVIQAPKIEHWIENVANRLYKQPDRWLVKKGASIENESI